MASRSPYDTSSLTEAVALRDQISSTFLQLGITPHLESAQRETAKYEGILGSLLALAGHAREMASRSEGTAEDELAAMHRVRERAARAARTRLECAASPCPLNRCSSSPASCA